jgi:uncharacterized membrane protein
MKKFLVALLILGFTEIFYGVLWGRLQIYKYEIPMIRDLGLAQTQFKAFGDYITLFKDQWRIVALFGAINVVLSILALVGTSKTSAPSQKNIS